MALWRRPCSSPAAPATSARSSPTARSARGDTVRVLDLNPPEAARRASRPSSATSATATRSRAACDGVDVVLHNVAQVPLAKDRDLFWSVNVAGTANVLVAARDAGVGKVVHTSSSAIFGIPEHNPVDEDDAAAARSRPTAGPSARPRRCAARRRRPGSTCRSSARARSSATAGSGIMAVLFEFVDAGAPVFVLGVGRQPLPARARRRPRRRRASAPPTAPAPRPTTSAPPSSARCARRSRRCASTPAPARACGRFPSAPAPVAMQLLSTVGLAPFAPYHWLLYSESLWFDTTKAQTELGWEPTHSNASMVIESYEWFLAHRDEPSRARSHHQSPVRLGVLKLLSAACVAQRRDELVVLDVGNGS